MSDAARIVVPCGWKRNVDSSRSAVIYTSPSGVTMSSIVEVFQYLEKDDTCKCGLSCPIHVPKVFSFNPDVGTAYYTREEWINYRNKSDIRMNKCQHWLKLQKMQKGKSKMSAPKPSSTEPPPKLLIIRKDGKLRSVIPDIASNSEKYKQSGRTDTSRRSSKSTGPAVRKANEVADLKLSLTSHSANTQSSSNTSVASPLKSPLFESTTVTSASNSNVKSKLQWIKADFETTGNDAESDTELCFSPDFKQSPTMPLPQSLVSGFVSTSKSDGLDAGNRSLPVKSFGDTVSRFGVHPNQDGSFAGMRPANFPYMDVSAYGPPNYLQGSIRSERLPHSNQIRHASPAIPSTPNFGGGPLLEQGRQCNSTHTPSDDQRQMFVNDGAPILHQATAHHSNQTGNVFNMSSGAQAAPAQQRLPLGSPPLLNPVSPYNFQLSNNGMMAPLGSPGGTIPSPYSNRSQSRSSSVGTPALSPGGIWPGPRHNVTDPSRPMSRSSTTATPGPDVSPGSSLGQWNGNVPNSGNYNARTSSCSFMPVLSPGSISSFPARFPTLPSTFSRFPHDGSSATGSSKFHQAPYQHEYAASQRLRMHSQTCHQQHTQRFDVPSRFRHYGSTQSTFGSNSQFPVLMSGAPQQVSHKASESLHQNLFRPTPPYRAPKMQTSRMCEPDAVAQPKFPFNSNQFNPQTPQQETCNIVQQQLVQQQWQHNASMTPRQYFVQNMMHPRAPIIPSQRPQLRPPKPKRTRKRKPKNVPNKPEPPGDTSTIKSEFPEIFDSQELPGLIPTSELLMEESRNELGSETMKFKTTDISQENSSSIFSPSLVLPAEVTTSSSVLVLPADVTTSSSVSSGQLIRINPSSLLQTEKSNNDENSIAKALFDTDKPDCSGRDVTTPPLPVLSPAYLMDHPESPEDDNFPELDFGTAASSNLLSFNPMTSVMTAATVSCVSAQCLSTDTISLAGSTSSTSVKNSALVHDNFCTEIFPSSTDECGLSTFSIKNREVPTSATSEPQVSAPSVFTTAASSDIFTPSSPSEKTVGGCSSSSISISTTTLGVSSCLHNLSSFMHTGKGFVGFQGGSLGVTSLVSSSGTLFRLPKLSIPKQICIHRRLSCQSPAGRSESHSTNDRRRSFSEPWQSCLSAATSRIVTSIAHPSGFGATPNAFDRKAEIEKLTLPQSQSKIPSQVVSTMKCSNDNAISSKTVISTGCLHEVGTHDPSDETIVNDSESTQCSNLARPTEEETPPKNPCIMQKVDQSSNEDMSKDSTAPTVAKESLNKNINLSSSDFHSSLSTDKTANINITVKEVVKKLVEEASSITLNNQSDCKKEELSGLSHSDSIGSSPHCLSGDSASQECSNASVMHRRAAGDCQSLGNEGSIQSSPMLKQIESIAFSTVNNVKISRDSAAEVPADFELSNICMQIGLDDLSNSKDIGTVFANSVEPADRISPIMAEEKGDGALDLSKIPRSTDTPLQTDTNCSEIESNHSPTITGNTITGNTCSPDVNAGIVDRLCDDDMSQGSNDSSDSMSVCPPISKVSKFGGSVESHSPTTKSQSTQDPPQDSQDPPSFPASFCADKGEAKVVSDYVSVLPTSLGGDDHILTNPGLVGTFHSEKLMTCNDQNLKGLMPASTNESHDNVTTSQVSSGYCETLAPRSINMPPEWTTTVIQQLSSYNRILKDLLVRQVSPATDIAQLASGSPNGDAKQADVISALFSNTVPQMTSAEIFHKTAVAMHGSRTMPVLPAKGHQTEPQSFDRPSATQNVYSDTHQCTSAVSYRPPPLQSVELLRDNAETSLSTPPPPDSSQVLNDNTKISVAKSVSGSDPSHQGLQVPIVSSSVKGTQEESNASAIEAKHDGSQPQDKVTTSVKSAYQIANVTPERRRGRSRTAANKQAIKRQQPVEITPVQKVPKRATSSGSSTQRSSQKQIRIVKNGDLIWGQMRGFPSWPGKVVKPSEVRGLQQRAPLSEGKVWVKWFGDHTFTQMNPADLVSMTEGLEAHHKSRRKGRTRTKKISAHLETAIQEAVDELEQQQGTSSRRFVEALQAAPVLGIVGKEQRDKPKRGRKRKGV